MPRIGRLARLNGSVGVALELPCRFEGVLDGTSVGTREVRDNHHVLGVPGRDAEGLGKIPQNRGPVVEVRADHQMGGVKLAGNQPPVVPSLGQPIGRRGQAHTR